MGSIDDNHDETQYSHFEVYAFQHTIAPDARFCHLRVLFSNFKQAAAAAVGRDEDNSDNH